MSDLIVKTEWGEEIPIHSNDENFCRKCGCNITQDNDSGWEIFLDDGVTTQKTCKECDAKMFGEGLKS